MNHSVETYCFTCGVADGELEQCYCGSYDLEFNCCQCGGEWAAFDEWGDEECRGVLDDAAEIIVRFASVSVFKSRLRRHMARKTLIQSSPLPDDINRLIAGWM